MQGWWPVNNLILKSVGLAGQMEKFEVPFVYRCGLYHENIKLYPTVLCESVLRRLKTCKIK